MASFRGILSLPHAFRFMHNSVINACANIGAKNSFNRLLVTQSRCLFIKKSIKDPETGSETEAESKKQHELFQVNYLKKNKQIENKKNLPVREVYSSLSDIREKIRNTPLDYSTAKAFLFNLLKIYKEKRFAPEFSTELDAFVKSEEFEKFTQNLEQLLPSISPKYLCIIFETMHFCQIPYSSILMQKLHVLILDNINNFELPDVIKMYLLIKDKNENTLEPLKNAFLAYMDHLAEDNLKLLGDLRSIAYFASQNGVPVSVREKILDKILSVGYQLKDFDPAMLTWLSFPMCSEEFKSVDKKSFFYCLKQTINNFEFKNLKTVLDNIGEGIKKKVILYDEELFNLMALAARNFELWKAIIIMHMLLMKGHINYELANDIAEKLIENGMKSLTAARAEEVIIIFGFIDYKNYLFKHSPEKWFQLQRVLSNYVESAENFKSFKTYLSLFVLELHTKELLDKALNDFAKVLDSQKTVSQNTLQYGGLLYQCHCAVCSDPPDNVPEKFLPDFLSKIEYSPPKIWKEAMYETFNGKEYVLENCKTPFGSLISYTVILGPDQNPINLSAYKKPEPSNSPIDFIEIEKIERPPGSRVFAFIEYTQEPIKYRNRSLLKLKPRIITRIHKNLDYRIFHLFSNQKLNKPGECSQILSRIMARELNYSTSRESESTTPEISRIV